MMQGYKTQWRDTFQTKIHTYHPIIKCVNEEVGSCSSPPANQVDSHARYFDRENHAFQYLTYWPRCPTLKGDDGNLEVSQQLIHSSLLTCNSLHKERESEQDTHTHDWGRSHVQLGHKIWGRECLIRKMTSDSISSSRYFKKEHSNRIVP